MKNDINLGFSTAVLGKAAIEGNTPFETAQTNCPRALAICTSNICIASSEPSMLKIMICFL